jgi:hypothetical protein
MTVFRDNKSTISLSNNPEFHSRTKHINIRFHYVRETTEFQLVIIKHIATENNFADIFTKGLAGSKHHKLIELIGLRQLGKKIESQISIKSINLTV